MAARRLGRSSGRRRTQQQHLPPSPIRRIASRRGKKRALVAVGHSILITIWHMITNGVNYTDLGADHFPLRQDRRQTTTHLINKLTQLGYRVTLEDTTTTAS